MAPAVAIAAEPAGEAAEEEYDQDNDEYRSKRHGALPEGPRAPPKTPPRPRSKHIPGRESLADPLKRGEADALVVIPGRCEASNPESRDSGSGPSDHPGMTTTSSLLRLVDREHLQRRRIGLDAKAVAGDQADLVQRRLLEIAAGGFAHRVLPRAHRSLRDQHFGDTARVLALDLGEIALADPDHDLVLGGDDFEQGDLVGGKGRLDHDALHDEGGKP